MARTEQSSSGRFGPICYAGEDVDLGRFGMSELRRITVDLEDYPLLEAGDITAALEYAARQSDHPVLRVA
jgi:hypothetical protein